jgi:CarD family transcriptional regulator
MAFTIGDTVVHPNYGAGIITDIREHEFLDVEKKPYYSIQLLSSPETTVMVAVQNEQEAGLRPTVSQSRLSRVWRILSSKPEQLPTDHNKRYDALKEKLYSGNVLRIAEVLRDLTWRNEQRRKWTTRGKRLYDRGIQLLAGEVAGSRHWDVDAAKERISRALSRSMAANPAM